MSNLFGLSEYQTGEAAGAASDLLGGIGGFLGGQDMASQDSANASQIHLSTQLKLLQQERMGYQVQSKAQAAIGASGLAGGGSAEEILRMNATNLALDHGILQMQGTNEEANWRNKASAAKQGAWTSLASGIISGGTKAVGAGLI